MPYVPFPATFAQRERFAQAKGCLEANGVTSPYVIFMLGAQLAPFMASVGKEVHFRDGPIILSQTYRYNMTTGRVRLMDARP